MSDPCCSGEGDNRDAAAAAEDGAHAVEAECQASAVRGART
jgi:hypothetical protein